MYDLLKAHGGWMTALVLVGSLSLAGTMTGCSSDAKNKQSMPLPAGSATLMDVHGAGAQRSDPKSGNPDDFLNGRGPQGDVIRIYNHVRLVRGATSTVNSYPVVDTGQADCYDAARRLGTAPAGGSAFFGQDAQYAGLQPSYNDNSDGTVTDNNTGLMWVKEYGTKMSYDDALAGAPACATGGYNDWRLPTIKELYSLILFSGTDPSGFIASSGADESRLIPFLDIAYFTFKYGDTGSGERIIDAQYASSTVNVSPTTMGGGTVFGVNFADGRIKAYPATAMPGGMRTMTFYVKYVRGNTQYGKNSFVNNGDGTISDSATGLTWDRDDSAAGLTWEEALAWVEQKNVEHYRGYSDWRLPNAKELQSIVDYTRSPSTSGSPAIDPLFNSTPIVDEGGTTNYAFYLTGTTHIGMSTSYEILGDAAVYLCFGEGLGFMQQGRP